MHHIYIYFYSIFRLIKICLINYMYHTRVLVIVSLSETLDKISTLEKWNMKHTLLKQYKAKKEMLKRY